MTLDQVFSVIVYEKATGKILDAGTSCLPETLVTDTEGVITDIPLNDVTGYRIDLNSNAVVALPPKPSPFFVFDYRQLVWVDPRTPETQWALVRDQRNRLLQESDWTQMPDVHIDTKDTWAQYRQELRDVTDQPDPFNIIWPTPPQ